MPGRSAIRWSRVERRTGVLIARRDGKVGNPPFGFPLSRPASPVLWEWGNLAAFGEISKGLVGSVGSPLLAFHTFHSPVISTAPLYLEGP